MDIPSVVDLAELDLIREITLARTRDTSLFFGVESDDIGEVVEAVGRLETRAREGREPLGGSDVELSRIVDAIEDTDVLRLMATARRDAVVTFVVVPEGARWYLTRLTSIPEDRIRWATL